MHIISFSLALMVFGYELFLKYMKVEDGSTQESMTKTELVDRLESNSEKNEKIDQMSNPD